MFNRTAVFLAVLAIASPPAATGFEYLGESKWNVGGGTASLHGFSAPNGPQTPGGATWSILGSGIIVDASAAGLDGGDHVDASPTVTITTLGVPTWALADYEAMIDSALNQWADVSGFTNLGKVADGGGNAGIVGASGSTGDIRIAAWRITTPGVLAHNFAPGSATSPVGINNNILGDMHIDKETVGGPTWVNDATDVGGPGGGSTYDLYTVVLHELGHALGLDHTTVPGSVMEASYKGGRRVLGADDIAGIQALYGGSGTVHFSVAPGTEGLDPVKPNAVFTSAPSNAAVVFVSPTDGTNSVAVPPPGLSLVAGDNINGLSNGTNGSTNGSAVLLFSVDSSSTGTLGTDVRYSALFSPAGPPFVGTTPANPGGGDPGNEAAGDIYASSITPAFGAYSSITTPIVAHAGKNRLFADEGVMGLQAPALKGSSSGAPEDELDGMELDGLSTPYFSLSAGSPTLLASVGLIDAHDGGSIPVAYDLPVPLPNPLHIGDETRTADDILIGGLAAIYGPGHLMGLNRWEDDGIGDDIDALIVSDQTLNQFPPIVEATPNGALNPGIDTALFSLAPGSPTLSIFSPGLGRTYSAADVFLTSFGGSFVVYASAESLGLLPTDNIDALDIRIGVLPPALGSFAEAEAVPEPSTFVLAILGLLPLGFVAWRRLRAS
ncbi:MAG: matrixin family metalloprotease [Planctomycetes bacterium]|nr:matrixin family metalloprotease [Planctomycetota bacterium]